VGVVGLLIHRREKKISDMEIEKFWQKQQRDRVKRDHEEKTFLTSQNEKATPPFFFFFFFPSVIPKIQINDQNFFLKTKKKFILIHNLK
jgi:hypothetical protein